LAFRGVRIEFSIDRTRPNLLQTERVRRRRGAMQMRFLRRALPAMLLLTGGALPRAAVAQPEPKEPPATAPAPPAADDPMLVPVPAPAKILVSWRQALALAAAEDPDYSISLFEIERSEGEERQVLAGVLPTLTGTGTLTFHIVRSDIQTIDIDTGRLTTETIPASPVATAALTLRQPLIAPRTWYAIGTASRATEAARMTSEDQRRQLVGSVAESVVAVVTAERIAEVNRIGLKAALDRLALQKRRLELGSGTNLDVVRFEQDVANARATLIQGDEDLRRARENLGLALGSVQPWGVQPNISLNEIEQTVGRVCKGGRLEERADLRALRAETEIAARAVTDADLLYAPTADLSSTLSYSSEDLVGDKNYAWNIQGVLTIPIWDGGARYGVRRSAEAVVRQQEERLDAATRVARVEVSRAERAVVVAQQSLDVATKTRDLAAETDRLSQRAFEGGAGTSFDLVDASRRLREAEINLALRELELVRARISAALATANCDY
jgi:outer membrane protein TolC